MNRPDTNRGRVERQIETLANNGFPEFFPTSLERQNQKYHSSDSVCGDFVRGVQ